MEELRELAQELKDLNQRKKELELNLKDINIRILEIKSQLADLMTQLGIEKVNFDFGLLKAYEPKLRVSVKKEDTQRLIEWLKAQGLDGIIKEEPSVHNQTLAATLKEEIMNGLELPEFINVYWQPDVRI